MGEGFFLLLLGFVFICFSLLTMENAFSRAPPRVSPPSSGLLCLSFLLRTACHLPTACRRETGLQPQQGPGEAAPPQPPVSKGRELKGGEDRERGREAEDRHQLSILQRLQIFTLVFFPPLPSWKGEAGPSTSKGNFLCGVDGRVI